MTRSDILEAARDAVTRDRAATHGRAEDFFGLTAALWSADLGIPLAPADVSRLMVLFKVARARGNPGHGDNWTDMAGYAALGGELSRSLARGSSAAAPGDALGLGVGAVPGAEPGSPIDGAPELAVAPSGADPERRTSVRLTDAALAEIWRLHGGGMRPMDIAAALGCPRHKVDSYLSRRRVAARAAASPAAADPAEAVRPSTPTLAPSHAEAGSSPDGADPGEPGLDPSGQIDPGDPPSGAVADPAREANPCDVPDAEGWTPREDLAVLEGFGVGEKSFAISQRVPGRSAAAIVRRFRQLVPRPGIAEQQRVLKAHRARVAEVDAGMQAAE